MSVVVAVTGGDQFACEKNYANEQEREADKSRMLRDLTLLFTVLNNVHVGRKIDLLLTDGASGPATSVAAWAETWGIRCEHAKSDLVRYGTAAVAVRKEKLVECLVDAKKAGAGALVVSLPGSNGNLESYAAESGVDVMWVEYEGEVEG